MTSYAYRILAVDDSESVRRTLRRIIQREGYEFDAASNGKAALEKMEKWLPDIVLLDVKMPVMNGMETCQLLKADYKYSFIYVIMLTQKAEVEDEIEGLDSGADDYVSKPFHPQTLLARIRRGLRSVKDRQESSLDPLTKLYNRRAFNLFLEQEKAGSIRYGRNLSFIIADLDNFKRVNDTFGHQTGDLVLKETSEIIREKLRASDLPARWGGEELAILLPETDLEGAKSVAESIRQKIESHQYSEVGHVTASLGVATLIDENTDLFAIADKALYQAKEAGRNRVVAAHGDINGNPAARS